MRKHSKEGAIFQMLHKSGASLPLFPSLQRKSLSQSEDIQCIYIYIYIYVYYIYIYKYIYVYYIYGFSTATEKVLTLRSDSDKILGNFLDSVPLVLIIVVVILVAVITTFVYSTI